MKVAYLIDTDWIIDHFKGVARTSEKLKELGFGGVAFSIISLAELHEGVFHSQNPLKDLRALNTFQNSFSLLGITEEICRVFGEQRGSLRKRGMMINDFDLLIASTCLAYDLTLLSNNYNHFKRIEGLRLLYFKNGQLQAHPEG